MTEEIILCTFTLENNGFGAISHDSLTFSPGHSWADHLHSLALWLLLSVYCHLKSGPSAVSGSGSLAQQLLPCTCSGGVRFLWTKSVVEAWSASVPGLSHDFLSYSKCTMYTVTRVWIRGRQRKEKSIKEGIIFALEMLTMENSSSYLLFECKGTTPCGSEKESLEGRKG